MRRHIIFGLLLMLLLVSAAKCDTDKLSSLFRKSPEQKPIDTDYHSGTEGLVMETIPGQPPDEIFKGTNFKLSVTLKNKGASDIAQGILYVAPYDYTVMEIQGDNEVQFTLEGRNPANRDGGYTFFDFNVANLKMPLLKTSTFLIEGCYAYGTEASVPLCVNPNTNRQLTALQEPCKVKDTSVSRGQGAPVAITAIKQRIQSGYRDEYKMFFDIVFENKGNGVVRDFSQKCGGEARLYIEEVAFSEFSMSDGTITCHGLKNDAEYSRNDGGGTAGEGSYYIELAKETKLSCEVSLDRGTGIYIAQLLVKLNYGYRTNKEVQVKVRDFE